ncbi:MAG: galactose-1-phosphate uridylyltransferase [bacterium]
MSELRRDPVVGRWVIISTERGERPTDYVPAMPRERGDRFCPFCPGNEWSTPPEILSLRNNAGEPDSPGWRIRVVANKYPALAVEGSLNKKARGIYDVMHGIGAHEVFIESPRHNSTISTCAREELNEIVWMYRERMRDLEKDRRIKYILIFRNSGEAAGASLEHPHSQLIATPTIPKRILEEIQGVRAYLDFKDRCVFCDMVDEELDFGKRIVAKNDRFVSFTPFAARFPFETWIAPMEHQHCFHALPDEQIEKFSEVLGETLKRLDMLMGFPPYNYLIHTSPCNVEFEVFYHWHLEIIPRLTKVAGFEWGSGFYINPMTPEEAAAELRMVDVSKGGHDGSG